jgi:hypothetical protein
MKIALEPSKVLPSVADIGAAASQTAVVALSRMHY